MLHCIYVEAAIAIRKLLLQHQHQQMLSTLRCIFIRTQKFQQNGFIMAAELRANEQSLQHVAFKGT